MDSLIAQFNEMPDLIRNKIIIYYLGFGTQSANSLRPQIQQINEIKKCSTAACTDDFTIWRFKVATIQSNVMQVESLSFNGYSSLCELTIALVQSDMCNFPENVKNARIFLCREAIKSYGIISAMI